MPRRPFLHATSLILLLFTLFIIAVRYVRIPLSLYHKVKHFPYIFLTASLSHHFRDGYRRGLWFVPFGNTKPLPYVLYVALTMTLPWILKYIIWLTESKKNIRKLNVLLNI